MSDDTDAFAPLDEEPVAPEPRRKVKVASTLDTGAVPAVPKPGDGYPSGQYPESGSFGSKP